MNNAPSPLHVALRHCCPRCGRGRIYKPLLTPRTACDECGLDYTHHDVGDGPAFFAIIVLGFVIVALALYLELAWRLPLWQNLAISSLFMLLLTPLCLRFFKSYLMALKYQLHQKESS